MKINHFKTKSLSRKVSSLGGHICNASGAAHTKPSPILMNEGILKSQKMLAELTIKLHMSYQQQQSEIHCPINFVSFAQIVFKNLIFQARPGITCHNMLIYCACALAGLVRFFMGNLVLSFKSNNFNCHSTCALMSEILESVLQTVQKQFTYWQYILTDLYRRQCAEYTYIYSAHRVYY